MECALILVDTNAWIGHLRQRDPRLVSFLLGQRVHTCDIVIGELLLGSGLPSGFVDDLLRLPCLASPGANETRLFIERHRGSFAGSGVGWADSQILLAAQKSGALVHTLDRGIRRVAALVGVRIAR